MQAFFTDVESDVTGQLPSDSVASFCRNLHLSRGDMSTSMFARNERAGLWLFKSENTALSVLASKTGAAGVNTFFGEQMLSFYGNDDGNSRLTLYDRSGSLRLSLGRQSLLDANRREKLTPASSIHLFDESGSVLFSAP